jgi:hypothetical protein
MPTSGPSRSSRRRKRPDDATHRLRIADGRSCASAEVTRVRLAATITASAAVTPGVSERSLRARAHQPRASERDAAPRDRSVAASAAVCGSG